MRRVRYGMACLWAAALSPVSGVAADEISPLPEVVITASRLPWEAEYLLRNVSVVSGEAIRESGADSIAEALQQVSGVSFGRRGPAQADAGIWGATFQQVLVLVDGSPIANAQTAHHNLDLPVSLEEIERIEILKGPASAAYGAGAIGGVIHIITRPAARGDVEAGLSAGECGTAGWNASAEMGGGAASTRLSLSGSTTEGYFTSQAGERVFREGSDAREARFSSRTDLRLAAGDAVLTFGLSEKEFGANNFYGGDVLSREWTRGAQFSASGSTQLGEAVVLRPRLYFRDHYDQFIYDEPGGGEPNRHRSSQYGAEAAAEIRLPSDRIFFDRLAAGVSLARDEIFSALLSDQSDGHGGVFLEAAFTKGRYSGSLGLRGDAYTRWGTVLLPSASVGWRPTPALSCSVAYGKGYRIPSYTELYYRDPSNAGSTALLPERSDAMEMHVRFRPGARLDGRASFFARRSFNLIDWVYDETDSRWKVDNLNGFVWIGGAEIGAQIRPLTNLAIVLAETAMTSSVVPGEVYSKYALDFPKHKLEFSVRWAFGSGGTITYRSTYRKYDSPFRTGEGEGEFYLADLRFAKAFAGAWTVSVSLENIFDRPACEVIGVPLPGRSFRLGLGYRDETGDSVQGTGYRVKNTK